MTGKGQTGRRRTRDDEPVPIRIAPARVDLPRRDFDVRFGPREASTSAGQPGRPGRGVRRSRRHEAASVAVSPPLFSAYRETYTHCTHGASEEDLGYQATSSSLLRILPFTFFSISEVVAMNNSFASSTTATATESSQSASARLAPRKSVNAAGSSTVDGSGKSTTLAPPSSTHRFSTESIPSHLAPLSIYLVLVSAALGSLISASLLVAWPMLSPASLQRYLSGQSNASTDTTTATGRVLAPQLGLYLAFWASFHLLEFLVTARWNSSRLMKDCKYLHQGHRRQRFAVPDEPYLSILSSQPSSCSTVGTITPLTSSESSSSSWNPSSSLPKSFPSPS